MMQFIGQYLSSDVRNNHDFSPCLTLVFLCDKLTISGD